MQVIHTNIDGAYLLKPKVFTDERGYLYESYQQQQLAQLGLQDLFVQDNVSYSKQNVLRGLHFQSTRPQGKLIQVLAGAIYDVAVDIDPKSASFGKYFGTVLSAENHDMLWLSPGLAHGFCVLSKHALVHYKCTEFYVPESEAGIAWNCPFLNINWPVIKPVLSSKDANHPSLPEYLKQTKTF